MKLLNIYRVINVVFYPWLLALYPVIYLYSVNMGDLRENDIIEVIFAVFVVTTIVFALLYLLFRDVHKAGVPTGIMALVFLTYGHIYNALDEISLGQTLLMPAMIIAATIIIVIALRSKTACQQLTPYLNIVFAILLFMPSWQVIMFHIDRPPAGATALANPLERVVSTPKVNNSSERPDIYYIILDGYSSNDFWLREYGYDNSEFTSALEGYGFQVAYDSESNYGATLLSLPSSLNMRYITPADGDLARSYDLPDVDYLRSLIANNRVADELQQRGYTYIYMMSGFLAPSTMADVNIAFYPEGPRYFSGDELITGANNVELLGAYKLPFWPFFLETTMLRSIAADFDSQKAGEPYPIYSTALFQDTLDEVAQIPYMEEATFTFVHITKPHTPIQYNRQGELIGYEIHSSDPQYEQYFFDELHYLNTRLLTLVDHILSESSVPPIIILQGDHDSALGHTYAPFCIYGFNILNVYYLPGGEEIEVLNGSIQPVNSFRMILNHYFDADYDLLSPEQYIINGCKSKDLLAMIRYVDDGRINVALGDHIALLYNEMNDENIAEIHVYAMADDGEKGDFLFAITSQDFEPFLDSPPEQNTLIVQQGQVAFRALTSGEFQFNIGPDEQGREWAVVIDGLPAHLIHGYEVGTE